MEAWQQVLGIFYLGLAVERAESSHEHQALTENGIEMVNGFETSNLDSSDTTSSMTTPQKTYSKWYQQGTKRKMQNIGHSHSKDHRRH